MVVAAGRSSRLPGSRTKPFLRVAGRTLLGHVLACFERAPSVSRVVVVAPAADLGRARRVSRGFAKVFAVVAGGERRQDSVRAGLRALPPGPDPILVHDAARPLIEAELVERCVEMARRHGAAIAARPVVDTLKRVEGGRVRATVDRAQLWRAETPQAFRRSWLEAGFAHAERDRAEVTDDAMLVERMGRPIRVVEGRGINLKVTTADDLPLVRALLAGRRRA